MNRPDSERRNDVLAPVIWLIGFIVLCLSMLLWVFSQDIFLMPVVMFGFTLMCLGGCIPYSHRRK
jgi:hypothetical protein